MSRIAWSAAGPGRVLALVLILSLAACTSAPVVDEGRLGQLPRQVELSGVPFHPQEAYQCGPAALATVLEDAGSKRSPEALKGEVYLPQRQGSLQAELLAATRRAGIVPYVLAADWNALLGEVAGGRPVLVLLDVGLLPMATWHYAVVVGYDRDARQVLMRSGKEARLAMGFGEFDRRWQKSGRWAFVAVPPERLPASASEDRYVAAAVTLEAVAPAAAERAYRSALERWPENLAARLGQGNLAYRRHDLAAAEAAYRRATADHPEAAAAWNNLAMTLHAAGRRGEALAAVKRAIEIGGPWRDYYLRTRATIEGGGPPSSAVDAGK